MITLLSPSKTQNFTEHSTSSGLKLTQPDLLKETVLLAGQIKSLSKTQVGKLLSVSDRLAELNHERYKSFHTPFTDKNSRAALLTFEGDVYRGFHLESYRTSDFNFAQKHLRILSGLYGILRPLDRMQPYRLEMKTKLKNKRGSDLYAFWGTKIASKLNADLPKKGATIINLASREYFDAVDTETLNADVISPVFKEKKDDKIRVIALFAKQARGAMADFIVRNRVNKPEGLLDFNAGGYRYKASLSTPESPVFVRKQP